MEGLPSCSVRRQAFSVKGTLVTCVFFVSFLIPGTSGEKPEDHDGESSRLFFLNKCPSKQGGQDFCGETAALLKFPARLAGQLTVADLELQLHHRLRPALEDADGEFRISRWTPLAQGPQGRVRIQFAAIARETPLKSLIGETLLVFPKRGEYNKLQDLALHTNALEVLPTSGSPPGLPTLWLSGEGEVRGGSALGPRSPARERGSNEQHYVLSTFQSSTRMSVASLLDRLNRGPHILPMRGGRREEVGSKDGYFLFLPRAEELARVFPSMYYFPVTLGKHLSEFLVDIEQMHSFPTSLSTYKCSNTDFHIFTEEGLADLATALSRPFIRRKGKIFKPIAAAVAARRPWYIRREQDPTVVLHQWWQEENTENGEEIWTETPLLWTFPDLGEVAVAEATAANIKTRWTDDLRNTSSFVRGFVKTSMSKLLISRLKNSYNIDREEARSMKDVDSSHSAAEYASLQDFFTRPINVEALRPWNPEALVAAPADAVLQNIFSIRPDADGYIRHHTVPQVKSTTFHLRRFLFGDETKDNVIKLQSPRNILVLSIHYLSPRDYHRFNSPADWHVTDQIYIPGCTPSVNRESLESREGILHHFERTSLLGTWDPLSIGERLFFSMNLVAARFVGGLSLAWEDKPLHPRGGPKACGPEAINYIEEKKVDIPLCMGQEVGAFRFGSTVVLAFEAPGDVDITSIGECSHALVGETLAVLPEYPRKLLERCNAFCSNYKNPVQYLNALKQHPEYDEPLRQNSLVRSDWRKKEGRVWAEKIRAIERGLGNRYAVGKFLLFQWNSERNPAVVKLSQPAALDRAGGQDKLGHYVPKCFRAKNTIGLRFEGRVSFLELEIPVNGKEALLFESPFKGCVGDEKLGKDTRGVVAFWRVSEGDELQVELRVESGTFSNGESPQLSVISGVLRLKGECKTEWKSMPRAGPTSTVCGPMSLVEKKERVQDVVTLSNADLATTPLYATPVSA